MHWEPANLEKLRKVTSWDTTFVRTPESESIEFDASMRFEQVQSLDLDESLDQKWFYKNRKVKRLTQKPKGVKWCC